jgi:2-keto-4-pentenoate hydratase/2-oxohepta-3-ene-1,7-dioic acid hydratase in catechol pathway
VTAHAGSLRIEGRAGSDQVRASGTAYASSRDLLEATKLTAVRRGDVVEVTVEGIGSLRNPVEALVESVALPGR